MRISVVSYLNSAPLVHGILKSGWMDDCEICLDIPSVGAARLASGDVDLALVPVGAFPEQGSIRWIGNYCIGVEGPVRTVCLFSEVPIDQIATVLLDSHSRTSAQLIQILATHHWKNNWKFLDAEEGFELDQIHGKTAGICIGDKVFNIETRYPYRYDLAKEWISMTGLPFVFAAWASKQPVAEHLIARLDKAQEFGIAAIPEIAREYSKNSNLSETEVYDYLTRNISYPLTEAKREGMNLFFSYLQPSQPPQPPNPPS